jgi:serine protease Do
MVHGRVRRGWIGVELVREILPNEDASDEDASTANIVVRSVVPDSPAQKAGVAPGDRIVEFDGASVDSVESLIDAIRTTPADRSVALKIRRDGLEKVIRVKLGELAFAP